MILTTKQSNALKILEDKQTVELYYGGAAGGGKSALGCFWQLKRRLKIPGSRGMIGRAVLKTLKETTLQTFFDIAKMQGVKRGIHFELTSAQDKEHPNCLTFINGSVIYLKDLYAYPNDPDFDELGSLEITDAFIDESPQVTAKAKGIVRSRIRFMVDDDRIPKLLMTGNPSKGWAYSEFYRPFKDGSLRPDKRFIQALPGDNKNLPASYIESLKGLDQISRERLLYGNWEYDDDPASLINYDSIIDCFTNDHVHGGRKYISADIARFGKDKTAIIIWNGLRAKVLTFKGLKITESAAKIKEFQTTNSVSNSYSIADDDGVGGGVVDILGCRGFVNNSKPVDNPITRQPENFNNLKSQCYFKLAEYINDGKIFIECSPDDKDLIIEELEQVKQANMDKDGKKQVISKDRVKEILGRSPDFSDAIMMRMFFELQPVFDMPASMTV